MEHDSERLFSGSGRKRANGDNGDGGRSQSKSINYSIHYYLEIFSESTQFRFELINFSDIKRFFQQ